MPRTAKSPKPEAQALTAPQVLRAPVLLLTGLHAHADDLCTHIAQQLAGRRVLGHTVVTETLATGQASRGRQIRQWLRQHQPSLVMCLGQAVGAGTFSLERAALNGSKTTTPQPVVAHGPTAYLSSLPLQAMQHGLHQMGLAAEVAPSATTEHGNRAFYTVMHELARHRPASASSSIARGGLLQVPESSDPMNALPLQTLTDGVRQALRYALWVMQDSPAASSRALTLRTVNRT